MINVVIIKNPFQPTKEMESYQSDVSTINSIVRRYDIPVNDTPIMVLKGMSREPLLRAEWDDVLDDQEVVTFMPVVDDVFSIIIIAVLAVASIAVALSLTVAVPNSPTLSEADPVYSLKGQTNQIKLNEPIESPYGRVRHWPPYGAKPYNKYINNEAYQYSLFCIGHGEYDIDQVYIEDTPIEDFDDVTYEIYGPNETIDLFRDNVQTSSEVGSIELFGPNESEYPADGWFVAVANDANTTTNLLEIDVTFPRGLYRQNSKGNLIEFTATAQFQYIEIDDDDNEIGTWTGLVNVSKTLATVNVQRFTYSASVPFGRYKVRGRRTNDASDDFKVGDNMVWETLRAYLPNVGVYGDVTMMAVRARASSNLNDQSKRKFNLTMTRKLPIWNGTVWSAPVATRSIVWAFCDIFRSTYGAYLDDDILDLDALLALDTEFSNFPTPRRFDWVFDSETTVWEAARTVCRAGRAIPMFNGSQVYMIIDKPQTIHRQLFNKENIVKDSFEEGVKLFVREEYDSIEVEYTDSTTWKAETVLCALPSSFAERPERIVLAGVTDRDRAFHEGMYMLSQKKYQRREITFRTGIEGLLATYGDLIKVDLDMFGVDDARGGYIESVESDNRTINLSEDVEFTDGFDYRLIVRGRNGSTYGPYTVTESTLSNQVVITGEDITDQLLFDTHSEPPLFIFGRSVDFAKDCVISSITPSDDDTVEIKAMLYRSELYAYDEETAPALNNPSIGIPDSALPVVTGVNLVVGESSLYTITWIGNPSAQYYVIQTSPDTLPLQDAAKQWDTIGQTSSTLFETEILTEDTAYIRVAAVNIGQGPWAYGEFRTLDTLIDDDGNTLIDDDGNLLIG